MSRFVIKNLRGLAMIAVIAGWGVRLAANGLLWADDDMHYAPATPVVGSPATPDQLLEAHDCWRQHAPPDMHGRLPGHVVVSTRSGRSVYGGTRLVGEAMDQQFAHQPAGLTVWGFCR